MTRICHLFDETMGWAQRLAVSHLLARLPRDRYSNDLACIHPDALKSLAPLSQTVHRFRGLSRLPVSASPAIARFLTRRNVSVVHAWGVSAAMAAIAAKPRSLIVELFDPAIPTADLKRLRTLTRPEGFGVVCASEVLRRRLVEGGVDPDLCVVIRPGVDFASIQRSQRGCLRSALGLSPEDHVVLAPYANTRNGGRLEAFWGAVLAAHTSLQVRFVAAGDSKETQRIERLARATLRPPILVRPSPDIPFEDLIAMGDTLVVAAQGDVDTTCIAWAMAARLLIIASAGYATSELIAHKVNGLLFKIDPDGGQAVAVARLLINQTERSKLTEVAHGQAYEVFGLRRFVEQHMRVYDNVPSGTKPGDGIIDSALTVG